MAAGFTVYCSRSVDHVTTADILAVIDDWAFHTSAYREALELGSNQQEVGGMNRSSPIFPS